MASNNRKFDTVLDPQSAPADIIRGRQLADLAGFACLRVHAAQPALRGGEEGMAVWLKGMGDDLYFFTWGARAAYPLYRGIRPDVAARTWEEFVEEHGTLRRRRRRRTVKSVLPTPRPPMPQAEYEEIEAAHCASTGVRKQAEAALYREWNRLEADGVQGEELEEGLKSLRAAVETAKEIEGEWAEKACHARWKNERGDIRHPSYHEEGVRR